MQESGPFFHRVGERDRFCFFHAPRGEPRGSILAVHPFAEELNKTRAAVAEGSRAFAADGFAVLQIDLLGCGDSAGDFADADWDRWIEDLASAWALLERIAPGPRWLWGTRLGALLAENFAGRCEPAADGLLFWQPVQNGAQHLNQFLRLKTVATALKQTLRADASSFASTVTEDSPRAELAAGRSVEIAGYRLNASLASALHGAQMGKHERVPLRVRWFDVAQQGSTTSPIAERLATRWRELGSDVALSTVQGPPFWQTVEVERCTPLVDASARALQT